MLDRVERLAEISVARGCGFAALATALAFIGTLPAGLPMAFRIAGGAALLTCGFLLLKALRAGRRPYQRTEVWAMLGSGERPLPDVAQRIVGTVLRGVFLRFAQQAAIVAAVMLALSLFSDGFLLRP
jgi:hypothetical protein